MIAILTAFALMFVPTLYDPVPDLEQAIRMHNAIQLMPPPPPAPTRPAPSGPCAEWVHLLEEYDPGWNIAHMQRIMKRESGCGPGAKNPSGATGLMQIMPMWVKHLGHCGVYSTADLHDPRANVCGAAHIFDVQGIGAWSQTRD